MKLPVKITFLLFAVVVLFVAAISIYFYRQIDRNFHTQADRWMAQSSAFVEQRLAMLGENLQREMAQLASGFFLENETTLASILATPPVFNTDVVNFAEKLRRRTTLDFLYVISADSMVLSNSLQPAAFGKADPRSDVPLDRAT
jgi:sensor histidine kinase regulating citrate/malate metabolism